MGRNATLDHARLIAAFGIVFFHAGAPGGAIGYAALPFFLILLVVLAAPGAARQGFTEYARGRAQRLLLPWMLWSAVYAALKLAELAVTGATFSSEFAPWMALTGPALHLWFLPFAFAACLLVHPLLRLGAVLPRRWGHGLPLALTALALATLAVRQGLVLPTPFAQWLYAMPAVFLGLALALGDGRLRWLMAIVAVFVAAAMAGGWTSGLLQLVLAAGALVLCIALPRRESAWSQRAGSAALGVYLAHPLVLSVLGRTTGLAEGSMAMAGLACIGALILTVTLSQVSAWLTVQSGKPRGTAQTGRQANLANTSA